MGLEFPLIWQMLRIISNRRRIKNIMMVNGTIAGASSLAL
jgi:hypothetical protein